MDKRMLIAVLVGIVGIGLAAAAGTFGGHSWFEVMINPEIGFTGMSFGLDLNYRLNGMTFGADSLFVLPGHWVWQGFTAEGQVSGFTAYVTALFGGDIAASLYSEAILSTSLAGIDFGLYAAVLGEEVFPGPACGAAVLVSGTVGASDITSVTEFGAQVEDDVFGGITIVHTSRGLERHYVTDPRVAGEGFTGQKFTVQYFNFCCAETIAATAYFTCEGFDYVSFGVEDLQIGNLPWLLVDAALTFELQTKSLIITPKLALGNIACFELYAALGNAANPLSIDAIEINGFSLECQLGSVTFRDVTLFAPCDLGLTTERYGSQVMPIGDILDNGMDYYADCFEMFSIGFAGPACCVGEYSFLANVYFSEDSTSLFGWAMMHVEATLPFGEALAFTFGIEVSEDGFQYLGFGFDATW